VFARKGESLEEYWDFSHRIFEFGDRGANMMVDDGGDGNGLDHVDWANAAIQCAP